MVCSYIFLILPQLLPKTQRVIIEKRQWHKLILSVSLQLDNQLQKNVAFQQPIHCFSHDLMCH